MTPAGVPHYLAFRLTVVVVVLAALALAALWMVQPGRWDALISWLEAAFR